MNQNQNNNEKENKSAVSKRAGLRERCGARRQRRGERNWLQPIRSLLRFLQIQMWANIIIGALTLTMWIIFFMLIFKQVL
jgi:hypothetical protein